MKFFAIFLCMVIRYAAGHLQRIESGEDDLKANENAMEAASLDARETNIQDQYIRSKDVHASVHSVASSSNETETYEQLPSVVTSMTEGKKRGQKVYYETRVMHDFRSLLKHIRRHIHAQKASKDVQRSNPETSAAIRRTDAYFATKIKRLFRAKRSPERDAKRKKFAPFQIFGNIMGIRNYLPLKMMKIIYAANDEEQHLLDSLASSGSAPPDVYDKYQAAKTLERKAVKDAIAEEPKKKENITNSYKLMIRDSAFDDYLYDHFHLREKHAAFFDNPSAALKKYNNMKREEFATIDSFLDGKSQGELPASFDEVPAKIKDKPAAKPKKKKPASKKVPAKKKGKPAKKPRKKKPAPKKAKHVGNYDRSNVRLSRQGRSKASQMRGQVFVIFLCMVIGYAAGHLQRAESGEDDLTANENAMEAASLDARETNIQDQYIRSKDVHASVHSVAASSNETETYEQLPSVVTSMTEGKKSEQKV